MPCLCVFISLPCSSFIPVSKHIGPRTNNTEQQWLPDNKDEYSFDHSELSEQWIVYYKSRCCSLYMHKAILHCLADERRYNVYKCVLGLNIFYSCRKYTEKDWVRLKMQHYPLQNVCFNTSLHLVHYKLMGLEDNILDSLRGQR